MSWKKTDKLMDTIRHYASFPATGVSLRQMVQFGERPSVGTSIPPLPVAPSASCLAFCGFRMRRLLSLAMRQSYQPRPVPFDLLADHLPLSRNSVPCIAVPRRGTTNSPGPPRSRTRRASRWSQRYAFCKACARLVRTVVRGTSRLCLHDA